MSARKGSAGPSESQKPAASDGDSKDILITKNTTDTAETAEQRAAMVETQSSFFRRRINNDAKAIMSGLWDEVKKPYKPKQVKDEEAIQWRNEVQRQEKIDEWMKAARKPSKGTGSLEESRYRVIMAMRKDSGFSSLAKKIPEPTKPASMIKPAPAPVSTAVPTQAFFPVSLPAASSVPALSPPGTSSNSLKRKELEGKSVVKQEIINIDQDDEEPAPEPEQSDYEPEAEAVVQREQRANKRQRTGDVSQPKQTFHNEDFELQLEEVRLKGQLQEVQIRRRMVAAKRRVEEAKQTK